jgi:uncharacterized protein (DUF2062 family)
MRHLRRLAQLVLRVEGDPARVALAFGTGIFLAFFPLFGVHTLMALGLAWAFRLNRVAVLAGTFTNNPWTIGPMYTAGTLLGCALLAVSPTKLGEVDWSLSGQAFYASALGGLRSLLWPFVVGNLVLGVVAGAIGFFVVRGVLRSRQRPTAPAPPSDSLLPSARARGLAGPLGRGARSAPEIDEGPRSQEVGRPRA